MLYQINNREVDIDLYQIRYDEKVVAVEPKVFDLIVYFINHRDRVISRAELFEQVWEGRTVSDTSLSNHIKSARKVLGDNGELQCVIKTVRSRGYQFIAEVQCVTSNEKFLEHSEKNLSDGDHNLHSQPLDSSQENTLGQPIQGRGKAFFFVVFIFLLFVTYKWTNTSNEEKGEKGYLLVVPFSIASNHSENWRALSDQMTREIIQNLRKISELNVVPPPSSFTFKSNKVRSHIKTQLPNVDYVLDGVLSESKSGELRLTLELENIKSGELLWDGDFDIQKNNHNLFDIQNNIASSVSESLKVIMLDKEKFVLTKAPTSNLKAYDSYVQGQYQLSLMTHDSVLHAIKLFNQAIELDAKFEAAYIAKSDAYRVIMVLFDKPKNILPKVISAALDVLAINPDSAQVMSHLGIAYVHSWQWEKAWQMLSMAKNRDPSIALTELGFTLYYAAMGNVAGVKRSLNKASDLDPLNQEIAEWGMWALMMNNEIDAAIKWGEEKQQQHPNNPYPLLSLSVAKYIKGNFTESINLAEQGVALSQREAFPLILLAQSYARAGQKNKARALMTEAQTKAQYVCPYETAITNILLDDTDDIFPLLEKAIDYQSNCLIFSKNDPRLHLIRRDIRFTEILKTIGLDDEAMAEYSR
ncbi:winged helix-turn-helix domain-containing protein [Thalassotalea castellviae]|uniref:Winged helix-turn-helix domain-containing protein n=1 Tax=Thalassotalea castellviae TaxID=3075612 RepID=A0ABU3A0K6_9GAMM|nr:winged helix-turn-helix domain-containing protein [Thalassotalea sp. W431]MDT0603709.1 winged helix-turn-helix domain-containing protein [Thalassotalea sp. W431]